MSYHYLHTDHLGTPILATTKEGATSWKAISEAFGAAQALPESSMAMNLRFPGQYFDQKTGTHYNFHRDYISNTGRYLQSDPIRLNDEINLYSYVKSNPFRYRDIFGLCKVEARCNLLNSVLKYSHCFIVVTEQNGDAYYFRGGPSAKGDSSNPFFYLWINVDIGYGTIATETGRYVPGTIDWPTKEAPSTGSRTYVNDNKSCTCLIKKLSAVLKNIENAGTYYNPLTTNSNATASSVLQGVGINPGPPPTTAPGWGIPLPGSRANNGEQCCDQ
jgi:RHS repeat-associated protein